MATDPIFDIKRPLRERTRIALSAEGPFAKGRREFHERPSQIAYAEEAADAIEAAVTKTLAEGVRTGDIALGGPAVGTKEMGDAIAANVTKA